MPVREDEELGAWIRNGATRHTPPPGLAARVMAGVQGADGAAPSPAAGRRAAPWRWLQAVALFGAGAATSWGLALTLLATPAQDALTDAVTSSHVRSLMGSHLVDVGSSDHHTVKPWFAGKLDFSPPVIDLAAEGYPLTGGRLDYLGGRAVAAMVYGSGSHVINLFVWPQQGGGEQPLRATSLRGFNLVSWSARGMQAWAVSDLNPVELQAFAKLERERMAAPAGTPMR